MSDTTVTEFLKEHPRLLGALFGATVLLTQVGAVSGAAASSVSGP